MNNSLLTTEQAAQKLGISPRTLTNARSSGVGISIPYIKVGSRVFYKESSVDSYTENNTFIHTGQKLKNE